jgi:molybdopterin molybdotransferase
VTYELLVRPAIRRLLGLRPLHRPRVRATLLTDTPGVIPREQYLPARLEQRPDGFAVAELEWHGSGDLSGFTGANSLLVVRAGGPPPEKGEQAEVLVIEESTDVLLAGTDG